MPVKEVLTTTIDQAKNIWPKPRQAAICIIDPLQISPEFKPGWTCVLPLAFIDDVYTAQDLSAHTDPAKVFGDYFQEFHALAVRNFMKTLLSRHVQSVVVCCNKGRGPSTSIAKFICDFFQIPFSCREKDLNPLVSSLLINPGLYHWAFHPGEDDFDPPTKKQASGFSKFLKEILEM